MKGNPMFSRGTGDKRKIDSRSNRREITGLSRNRSVPFVHRQSVLDNEREREKELSRRWWRGGKVMGGGKKTRRGSRRVCVYLIRTHCARMMPAPRRPLVSSAAAEAVCRRPSSAPSSGTVPVAPCWCSPCARWPCNRDIGHPDGCDRAAPGRTRRTAWSCGTCTRAKCARPRTRGSSCESNLPCSRVPRSHESRRATLRSCYYHRSSRALAGRVH